MYFQAYRMLLPLFSQNTFTKMRMDKFGDINSYLIYESKFPVPTNDSAPSLQTFEDSPNSVKFQNLSDRNYKLSWKDPAKQTISCAEHNVWKSKCSEVNKETN